MKTDNKLIGIIDKFKTKKILVIGDVMLDKYVWGDANKISPEAPVMVVNITKENYTLGGAGNTANNISSLGGNAFIVGVVGGDAANDVLIDKFKAANIDTNGLFQDVNRPTIQKIRIMAQSQQLLRIDYEKDKHIDSATEQKIIDYVKKVIRNVNAIVVSDYAKGVVKQRIIDELILLSSYNHIPLIVDPKPKNHVSYSHVTLITPNHKEAEGMLNMEERQELGIEEIGRRLIEKTHSDVLITRGEKGMSLFEKNGKVTHIPTKAKEVYDVSGAGDTVVATLALALASGAELNEAAILANHAAGITVGKVGTSTVSIDELKESLNENDE